jgi:hypothetical protein
MVNHCVLEPKPPDYTRQEARDVRWCTSYQGFSRSGLAVASWNFKLDNFYVVVAAWNLRHYGRPGGQL